MTRQGCLGARYTIRSGEGTDRHVALGESLVGDSDVVAPEIVAFGMMAVAKWGEKPVEESEQPIRLALQKRSRLLEESSRDNPRVVELEHEHCNLGRTQQPRRTL